MIILSDYANFIDVFSLILIVKFLKYTEINDNTIKLIDDKQSLYKLIYSLKQVKLETLKTYIETNLIISFIRPLKSLIDTLIFII